jgi:hypothetical protein
LFVLAVELSLQVRNMDIFGIFQIQIVITIIISKAFFLILVLPLTILDQIVSINFLVVNVWFFAFFLISCFSHFLVNGAIVQISYSDSSCSSPNIGFDFPYSKSCSATPAVSGTYFDHYRSSCSSSSPYTGYENSTYYVGFRFVRCFLFLLSFLIDSVLYQFLFFYFLSPYVDICSAYDTNSCVTDEVIATNGYLNGQCLTVGVGSFKYAWPKLSYYFFSTSCRGTPTLKTTINTNCNSDSATFGPNSFDTNVKASQIHPDSSSDDNSLSAGVIAGIVIGSFCGFAIIVAVISFFCRCCHCNRESKENKASSSLPVVVNDAKMPAAVAVPSKKEYELVQSNVSIF